MEGSLSAWGGRWFESPPEADYYQGFWEIWGLFLFSWTFSKFSTSPLLLWKRWKSRCFSSDYLSAFSTSNFLHLH